VIAYEEIVRARETISGVAVRTPLVPLDAGSDARLYLKLETLQPVNSFKIRGAGNAVLQASNDELADGVVTASAGNMAQGVAYAARLRGVTATIVVPEGAPETKVAAIERFGGRVVALPYDDWWRVLVEGRYDGAPGLFIHPVDDVRVMAGNGTIGLEILEDLPDVDTILMLRPTESQILWLQQFGRGLRYRPEKRLKVIDYIGNHRSFLLKPRTLFQLEGGDVGILRALNMLDSGNASELLPPNCSVTYDLEAKNILRELIGADRQNVGDRLRLYYEEFRSRTGFARSRPRPSTTATTPPPRARAMARGSNSCAPWVT